MYHEVENLGQDGKIAESNSTEDDAFYFNGQRLIPGYNFDNSYIGTVLL